MFSLYLDALCEPALLALTTLLAMHMDFAWLPLTPLPPPRSLCPYTALGLLPVFVCSNEHDLWKNQFRVDLLRPASTCRLECDQDAARVSFTAYPLTFNAASLH